jgi:hypothetical protein
VLLANPMIRLMICDKCGYVGDLSNLPGDTDISKLDTEELRRAVVRELVDTKAMFQRIGWTRIGDDDLCTKCSKK